MTCSRVNSTFTFTNRIFIKLCQWGHSTGSAFHQGNLPSNEHKNAHASNKLCKFIGLGKGKNLNKHMDLAQSNKDRCPFSQWYLQCVYSDSATCSKRAYSMKNHVKNWFRSSRAWGKFTWPDDMQYKRTIRYGGLSAKACRWTAFYSKTTTKMAVQEQTMNSGNKCGFTSKYHIV